MARLLGPLPQQVGRILGRQRVEYSQQIIPRYRAQHRLDRIPANRAAAVADGLIEQTQGVAHAAVGSAGQLGQRLGVGFHPFLRGQVFQLSDFAG